jgi:hypothetical protein
MNTIIRLNNVCRLAAASLVVGSALVANAAVNMSFNAAAPTTGTLDQYNFTDDAMVPGGTAPGGGTFNSQSFSDNGGPPGQTFTTPAGTSSFVLNTVSLKGANTGGSNFGGFGGGTTWGVRISEVTAGGTTLVPALTVTGVPTGTAGATGNEWFTWAFTGADAIPLTPSTLYSFEVFSSAGYLGFDAATTDTAYAGGTAFNSAGAVRSFADLTTGNLANHGYDRTFHVGIGDHVFLPGDVDDNGTVNALDFGIIRDHFKQNVTARNLGDLDGDGVVGFPDYLQWRTEAPPALAESLSLSVPEPTTLALLASVALGALHSRRRINS